MFVTRLHAEEKWRIVLVPFHSIGAAATDDSIKEILHGSLKNLMETIGDFQVINGDKIKMVLTDRDDALTAGRDLSGDVIIYGDYYVQDNRLVIWVEVLDVLKNEMKLRTYYSGELSLDLFDTIDSASSDIVKKVREALPKFTTESEVEIQKVRKTVYEQQELKLKRLFYTHLGFVTEFGYKHIQYSETNIGTSGTNANDYNYTGRFPFTQLEFALTFRFGNVRLDAAFTGLPGVPQYYYFMNNQKLMSTDNAPGYSKFSLSWYPKILHDKLAVGVGLAYFEPMMNTNNWNQIFGFSSSRNIGKSLSIFLFYHPTRDLEFEASVKLPIFDNLNYPQSITNSNYHTEYPSKSIIPALTFSTTWFFSRYMGIKVRAYFEKGEYYEVEYSTELPVPPYPARVKAGGPEINTASVYLGVVYRADFL